MKRTGVFVILIVLLLTFFVAQQFDNLSMNSRVIEEGKAGPRVFVQEKVIEEIEKGEKVRVYIKFKDSAVSKKGIASDVKKEIKDSLEDKVKHEFKDRVSAVISEEELEELKNNSNVESIKEVGRRKIALQDSVPLINATTTWNVQIDSSNLTGEHETICIIDTGVNYSHSDLGGCFGSGCKVIGGYDYCADDTICTTSDADPMDAHYHGTHVSGIAAADGSIKGVAPDANLVVIKAANASGTFWDDDLEKAIDWCVNNASTFNISVISMSLGGGLYSSACNDDPLNESINNAIANNISVVVAAGNDDSTTQISAPACHENVTPIGGIGKDDSTFDFNRNNLVLLIAPGISIISTDSDGVGSKTLSGTSMSTPHVAGAIAIINQFRRLEGNSVMTPSEIEDALNDSGEVRSDSGSGLDYSRINLYATLLDIDSSAPEVTLSSPSDNYLNSSGNQTLSCSSTDELQLANLTIYLWNTSNVLINETSVNATNNSLDLEIDVSLDNGTYKWNCISYDEKGNSAYGSSSNYSIKIGAMDITLSPSDETYKDSTATNFTCVVNDTVAELVNITFKIWNASADLIYNQTEEISGTSNQTIFNYSLTSESSYEWNCEAFDEHGNSISEDSNYTITYDDTNPVVTLVSPADEAEEDEGSISFKFNVTDSNNINNCSLIIDDDMEGNDNSITKDTTQTITESLSEASYDWRIRCRDVAGNIGSSSERELEVASDDDDDDDDDDDSSGGGGEGSGSATKFTISDADFKEGASKYMKNNDYMSFNIDNESHKLTLKTSDDKKIKVVISSSPITVTIEEGKTEKVDVDSDNVYDLEATYLEYKNTLARIKIKKINEAVPTREIQDEGSNEENATGLISNDSRTVGTGAGIRATLKNNKITIFIIILVVLGVASYMVYKKRDALQEYVKKSKQQ